MTTSPGQGLVIEDDPRMQAIFRSLLDGLHLMEAKLAEEAKARLHSNPVRLVSFDLQIPDAEGLLTPKLGVSLLAVHLPLARKLIYTGFRDLPEGISATYRAGRGNYWLMAKGGANEVEGHAVTANPLGWCALMLHLLGQPWPSKWTRNQQDHAAKFIAELEGENPLATEPWSTAYWRLAGQVLPQPLAEAAARYHLLRQDPKQRANEVWVGRESWLALNDFREWALALAAAQTAVILRQVQPAPPGLPSERSAAAPGKAVSDWLQARLPGLHSLDAAVPGALAWRNHLGITAQPGAPGGHTVTHSVLDDMDALRRRRNASVHSLRPSPTAEADLPMLPPLMDLASHWANHPLLTQVRRDQGRWRARLVAGPQPEGDELALPEDLVIPRNGIEAGHVYQWVWRFDAAPQHPYGKPVPLLLDWWPYLRWHFNRTQGKEELVLLTQPVPGDPGRWMARSLAGAEFSLHLSAAEQQALTRQP